MSERERVDPFEAVQRVLSDLGHRQDRQAGTIRLILLLGCVTFVVAGFSIVINGCSAKSASSTADRAEDRSASNSETLRCITESKDRAAATLCLNVQAAKEGRAGKAGTPGGRGKQGVAGVAGSKGDKGDKGDRGSKGDKGDKGDACALPACRGPQGATGSKGDDGVSATPPPRPRPPGAGPPPEGGGRPDRPPRPERGPQGDQGPTGPQGETGATGAPGAPGTMVLDVETACPTGLLGGLTPGIATDPDGDGHFTCPR